MASPQGDSNLPYRIVLLLVLTAYTTFKVNDIVPEPYLDEVFHIPQSQKYCGHNFDQWDDKITTPPGLYLLAYLYTSIIRLTDSPYFVKLTSILSEKTGLDLEKAACSIDATSCGLGHCSTVALRSLNAIGGSLILPWICYEIYLIVHSPYHQRTPPPIPVVVVAQAESDIHERPRSVALEKDEAQEIAREVSKKMDQEAAASQTGINIALFPLLYFFNFLFYTDIWSTIFVLLAYRSFLRYSPAKSSFWSFISILFRQTNVLWTGFLLVLELVRLSKRLQPQQTPNVRLPFGTVISRAFSGTIYDLPIHSAKPLDYVKTIISTALAMLRFLSPSLILAWPYITVIALFGGFVWWNGSIALGDKTNHVAAVHLTQIFYFFFFTMFSTPALFLTSPLELLGDFRRSLFGSFLNLLVAIAALASVAASVHYFTITHPFMLADNRHYVFYLWRRTILADPNAKFGGVVLYFVSCWLVLRWLGNKPAPIIPGRSINPQASATTSTTNTVTFLLAFTGAMSLTLLFAPLVEFRYFIVPWTIWRLHVTPPKTGSSLKISGVDWRIWIETVEFLFVHGVTMYLFLYRPFKWPSEEGWQRFMW